jgi:cholinesterase
MIKRGAFSYGVMALLVFTGAAVGAPYDALYVFGDSYSDIGARYVDGNGPTAVAYLAQRMGIELSYPQAKSGAGRSLDFAASGASTGREPRQPSGVGPTGHWCCQGMLDQVEDFASRVRSGSLSFNPQSTLFFIAGGLNDGQLTTQMTLENIESQILLLKDLGAEHVRLALLPTKLPVSTVGKRLNPAYRKLVSELRAKLAIDLQLSDWGLYFDEVMQHPARYGMTNTTAPCAGRALFGEDDTPCARPDAYFYYHVGHPSTAVHRIVGLRLYREIISTKP